ncbi:MAG: DUF5024 domain-containing protein [Duncaniella sp.]|nr:DUF5024 domain-containing protein [Duncaniella sp.]
MKFLRYILMVIAMLPALGAMAQSSIDAAIAALQKSKSVTNEIFSEKRDPSTRAVIRSSRMFNFDDDKMAAKIRDAMKKERSKAVAFQMKTTSGAEVYSISFEDNKHMCLKYVLIRQHRGGWVLSVDKAQRASSSKDRSDSEITDTIWFDSLPAIPDSFVRQMTLQADEPEESAVVDTAECHAVIIVTTDMQDTVNSSI